MLVYKSCLRPVPRCVNSSAPSELPCNSPVTHSVRTPVTCSPGAGRVPDSEVVPGHRPAPRYCPPRSRRSFSPGGPSVSNASPKSTSHWRVLSARPGTGRRQPAQQTNHLFVQSFSLYLTDNYSQITGKQRPKNVR